MLATSALNHALTFTAGFLVRPCCVIPAALAVIGASGAGVAAAVAPYRPWFLLIAAIFFGASFYWNFIRNRNRAGMAVWAASLIIAALLLVPGCEPRNGPVAADQATEAREEENTDMQSITIPVKGMACGACANRLEKALSQTPGVSEARVDFDVKQAHVKHDPAQVELPALEKRIREAGFEPAHTQQTE